MTPQEALREAIRRAGNKNRLARALGIDRRAIQTWKVASVKRVLDIERLTGVSRQDLRPDIYPREDD